MYPKNRTESNQKNSTKPEPNLSKYMNRFKILTFGEPKSNPDRTKIFWVSENIQIKIIQIDINDKKQDRYINYFRFNIQKISKKIEFF